MSYKITVKEDIRALARQGNITQILHLANSCYADYRDSEYILNEAAATFRSLGQIDNIFALGRTLAQSEDAEPTIKAILFDGFEWDKTKILTASNDLPPSKLYRAAAAADFTATSTLIRNANKDEWAPALRVACLYGHFDLVKFLWEQRPDKTPAPDFALALAALAGHEAIVDYLNAEKFPTTLALHLAIRSNQAGTALKVLSREECDANARDRVGTFPIALAMQQPCGLQVVPALMGRSEITPAVLDYGCRHNLLPVVQFMLAQTLTVDALKTAIRIAVEHDSIPVIVALLEMKDDKNKLALYTHASNTAIINSKLDIFRQLLKFNQESKERRQMILFTQLQILAKSETLTASQLEIFQLILAEGVCDTPQAIRTIAQLAKNKKLLDALKAHYDNKLAQLTFETSSSYSNEPVRLENPAPATPLAYFFSDLRTILERQIIETYSRAIQDEIIETGAYHHTSDLRKVLVTIYYNQVLDEAFTDSRVVPFVMAARCGLPVALEQEWPSDNNPALLTQALDVAGKNGHLQIVMRLLERGAEPSSNFVSDLCAQGQLDILKAVLAARPNATIGAALVTTVTHNRPMMFDLILAQKPNLSALDSFGHSALSIACRDGRLNLVKKLLEAKADVNQAHEEHIDLVSGMTPLMYACCSIAPEHAAVVDLLLEHHANVETQNSRKETAISLASEKGKTQVVAKLLATGPDGIPANQHGPQIPAPKVLNVNPVPSYFKDDPRKAAIQTWVDSHLKTRSSLFEVNRLKLKLIQNALDQLSKKKLLGEPADRILNTSVQLSFTPPLNEQQIELLKSKHNLDLSQPTTLLQLSQLQRNPWSHGMTKTTKELFAKFAKDLSVRDRFVLYLEIEKARLDLIKNPDEKTKRKCRDLSDAIQCIKHNPEANHDLGALLNAFISDNQGQKTRMLDILEQRRGYFNTTTMADLKLVFGKKEVETLTEQIHRQNARAK